MSQRTFFNGLFESSTHCFQLSQSVAIELLVTTFCMHFALEQTWHKVRNAHVVFFEIFPSECNCSEDFCQLYCLALEHCCILPWHSEQLQELIDVRHRTANYCAITGEETLDTLTLLTGHCKSCVASFWRRTCTQR